MATEFNIQDLLPQEPWEGPPLPEFLNIYWPWHTAPGGANIILSDLSIYPKTVQVGNEVTVSCVAENTGDEAGDKTITCKVGGEVMAEQTISLEPGESQVVSFQVTPEEAKTYQVAVDGLSGSFTATTEPVADIQLSNLVISPTECNVGDEVLVSVTATNNGGAAGSRKITCTVT